MTITRDSSISFRNVVQGRTGSTTALPGYTVTSTTCTATRTRTGTRLPHYRDIIKRGGNATTPMTAVWDTIDDDVWGYCKVHFGKPGFDWTSENKGDLILTNDQRTLSCSMVAPNLSSSFTDNLARAKFYKRLHDQSTKFQGLTFVGELRESLHMLRRPASALWSSAEGYLSALNKRKRASPKHWTKAISGLWLEHTFGWVPLIHDCQDAVKAYQEITTPTPRPVIISAGAKYEYFRGNGFPATLLASPGAQRPVNNGINFDCTAARWIEEHRVRYKGAVRATVEAPRWSNWELFGFTPKELIPTAWELLPWSFLVDYFTNIGDILQATVTSTRNIAYVNRTTIKKGTLSLTLRPNEKATANRSIPGTTFAVYTGRSQGTATLSRRTVSRDANSGISLPRFQFSFDLSDGQLGNIAALLGQARALHPQQTGRKFFR